jgi:rod shape-determining protein MreC
MALLETRDRAGTLFVAILLGHIILISAQVNSRSGVPVLESVTFGVFAEVQRAASSVVSAFRGVWGGYVGLREVRVENERLKRALADAEMRVQQHRALADRSRGLERLLELKDRLTLQTVAAEVIAAGATPEFRTITIDKGMQDGLGPDMAVISPSGVVGRIVVPSHRASKVQLLIDRNAAAGALIERTRAQGVAVGLGEPWLRLEYVPEIADVAVGDLVVTSGIDKFYPKGLIIGRVESVEKSGSAYKEIRVKPDVNFSSLEEVLVVQTPPASREAAEVEGRSQ